MASSASAAQSRLMRSSLSNSESEPSEAHLRHVLPRQFLADLPPKDRAITQFAMGNSPSTHEHAWLIPRMLHRDERAAHLRQMWECPFMIPRFRYLGESRKQRSSRMIQTTGRSVGPSGSDWSATQLAKAGMKGVSMDGEKTRGADG